MDNMFSLPDADFTRVESNIAQEKDLRNQANALINAGLKNSEEASVFSTIFNNLVDQSTNLGQDAVLEAMAATASKVGTKSALGVAATFNDLILPATVSADNKVPEAQMYNQVHQLHKDTMSTLRKIINRPTNSHL